MYYYDGNTLTLDEGENAGTVVVIKLAQGNILNQLGDTIARWDDTSLVFDAEAVQTERAFPNSLDAYDEMGGAARAEAITDGFTNGQYCVDYSHGVIYAVKQSDSVEFDVEPSYKIPVRGSTTAVSTVTQSVKTHLPKFYEDTSFVAGDSPVVLDLNTDLGFNATEGWVANDGDGDFTVAYSVNGTDYSDEITVKIGEAESFNGLSVAKIRITRVEDSSYRVKAL